MCFWLLQTSRTRSVSLTHWQCEGLDLPFESIIQLVAPVEGLNDAFLRWHRILTIWFIKQGCRKSLLEPSLCVHHALGGSVDGLILIEVDDLARGIKRMQEEEFQQRFQVAFRFGSGKNGKPVMLADESDNEINMFWLIKKYIWKNLHPVCVRNSRRIESFYSMSLINSVLLCIRSVGSPRRVDPRLLDPRQFWHNI